MPDDELRRVWERLDRIENEVDQLRKDVRQDIRDLTKFVGSRFNGTDRKIDGGGGVNWMSVIATILGAMGGIGVPIAVAILIAGGP